MSRTGQPSTRSADARGAFGRRLPISSYLLRHATARYIGRLLVQVVLAACVVGFYALVATGGTMTEWVNYTSYHDMLADAFRHRQLSLLVSPPPQLLAQPNPQSPDNVALWMWDASLYAGKYYIYWGPFPAMVQAVAKAALGIDKAVGDQYLVFGFVTLSALLGVLLVLKVLARLFAHTPGYLSALACLAVALANPLPYLLARAGVYEAAIAAGQALLLAGLNLAFDAVWHRNDAEMSAARLLAAGTAWGLAGACRVTLLPAVALLIVLTTFAAGGAQRWRGSRLLGAAACLAAPVAVCTSLLLLYNKMRFHQWLEFGVSYQLTTFAFKLSRAFVPANLYSYLVRAPEWECHFPFAGAHWVRPGASIVPAWMRLAPGYMLSEPVVGVLIAVPIVWLAVPAVVNTLHLLWRWARRRGEHVSRWSRAYVWCASSFLVMGTVTAAADLTLFMASMRYLCDTMFGLVLLGIVGALTVRAHPMGRAGRALCGAACASALFATIAFGMCIGFQGYYNHVAVHAPALYARLAALSLCP